VQLPELHAGDVVELSYRIDDASVQNDMADYFGEIEYLQDTEPVASAAVPAASAAADPPLDPPGEYCVFHGLRLTPQSRDQVTGAQQNSGVVVLACTMAPASMMRCTKALVLSATLSRSALARSMYSARRSSTVGRLPPASPARIMLM